MHEAKLTDDNSQYKNVQGKYMKQKMMKYRYSILLKLGLISGFGNITTSRLLIKMLFYCIRFTENYGMMGILDRLHGTDKTFRASKMYQRHIMLWGLTPLTQQIPDDKKKL